MNKGKREKKETAAKPNYAQVLKYEKKDDVRRLCGNRLEIFEVKFENSQKKNKTKKKKPSKWGQIRRTEEEEELPGAKTLNLNRKCARIFNSKRQFQVQQIQFRHEISIFSIYVIVYIYIFVARVLFEVFLCASFSAVPSFHAATITWVNAQCVCKRFDARGPNTQANWTNSSKLVQTKNYANDSRLIEYSRKRNNTQLTATEKRW